MKPHIGNEVNLFRIYIISFLTGRYELKKLTSLVTARQRENTMQYIHMIDGTNRNIQKVNNLLDFTENIYRLLHRKCDVRIFIHELQDFGKRVNKNPYKALSML